MFRCNDMAELEEEMHASYSSSAEMQRDVTLRFVKNINTSEEESVRVIVPRSYDRVSRRP